MNAPTRKLEPIDVFLPTVKSEAERALRERIKVARDLACDGIGHWDRHCDGAQRLHALIAEIACAYIYRPASVDTLRTAADICRRLLLSASELDYLEGVAIGD